MSLKVVFVGDSRKMRGGVSTVMKSFETSWIWNKYNCYWLQTQVNSGKVQKIFYLVLAWFKSLFVIPQYDIVHFQTVPGSSMITLLPIFLYALILRKKIVVHLHVGNQIQAYVNNYFFQFWMKHSDEVLFLGKMWCNKISPYIHPSTKTDYLYNPTIDIQKPCLPDKYFLFAAFLNENKGYDVFLKAFATIVHKNPGWKVVLCGIGDNGKVESLIKSLGIQDSVIRPGWVENKKKEFFFKNAYVYCMASWKEGLPLSVLEAMAYGVPLITTPVGCIPEFLSDGISAKFVDFGNVNQMANAMQFFIDNPQIRVKMSLECQKIVLEKFTIDKICQKLDLIYQSL